MKLYRPTVPTPTVGADTNCTTNCVNCHCTKADSANCSKFSLLVWDSLSEYSSCRSGVGASVKGLTNCTTGPTPTVPICRFYFANCQCTKTDCANVPKPIVRQVLARTVSTPIVPTRTVRNCTSSNCTKRTDQYRCPTTVWHLRVHSIVSTSLCSWKQKSQCSKRLRV